MLDYMLIIRSNVGIWKYNIGNIGLYEVKNNCAYTYVKQFIMYCCFWG